MATAHDLPDATSSRCVHFPELTSLSPRFSEAEHGEYVRALKKALKNADLHNVALSGPYGSGKSSILQGLLLDEEVRGYKPRVVSLATLGPRKHSPDNPMLRSTSPAAEPSRDEEPKVSSTDATEAATVNLVQKEVCKQLLYSASPRELPMSQYFRPYQPTWWGRLAAGAVSLLPALIITGLAAKAVALPAPWEILFTLVGALVIAVAVWCLWPRIAGRVMLSEVGTAGAKVSLGNQPTYFDEHLAELKYFFEATGVQLVIFEDLDRFDSLQLVETLRDLNLTLNSEESASVRFVYALGDSLFSQGESRSKLFDAIIPVVPFASHNTSRGLLAGALESVRPAPNDDDAALFSQVERIITDHAHDHRLLTTVTNEFQVYMAMHAPTRAHDMRDSLLLAAVAYKCIHPSDFAKGPALKSRVDKLNAAVATDRDHAIQRLRALRDRVNRPNTFLTSSRVDKANSLLKLIVSRPTPLTGDQWSEALTQNYRIEGRPTGKLLNPAESALLLSGGESDHAFQELARDERRALVLEIDGLVERARLGPITILIEGVICRVNQLRDLYFADADPYQWESPAAFRHLTPLGQHLVSRVINSLTVWDDGICRHLCWRSAKRTVRP